MESCSLYIHVPFCIRKCNYCDFVSYRYEHELAEKYLLALFSELELLSRKYNHPQLKTIYLGGGTPTCLGGERLRRILQVVQEYFPVALDVTEVTCEMNPVTVKAEDLQLMREAGYNRVSIGVQSFDEQLLRYLGRLHDVEAVYDTYEMARVAGFNNINLDLIFAIPGQSREVWQDSLRKVLSLQPEHLSLYNLKIEEGTLFYQDYIEGKLIPVDEETDYWMYEEAINLLQKGGLEQYEISNFARPGYSSQHNLCYWRYQPYLAVGPGAHGFDGILRYANTSDVHKYLTSLEQKRLPWEEVIDLTIKDRMEEFMMMGLRLVEGVSFIEFERRFSRKITEVYSSQIAKFVKLGLLSLQNNRIALTDAGIPLGNEVFAEFLL